MVWKIKNFPGGREFVMRCRFALPSVAAEEETTGRMPPIRVNFELPYFTVSGIQVCLHCCPAWGGPVQYLSMAFCPHRCAEVVRSVQAGCTALSDSGDVQMPRSACSTGCALHTRFAVLPQVRYLKVIEKSGYQALPWVRYITAAGEYEIRMA